MYSANLKASLFHYRYIQAVQVLHLHMVLHSMAYGIIFTCMSNRFLFSSISQRYNYFFFLHKYYFLISQARVEDNSVQNLVLSLTDLTQYQNQRSNKEYNDDAKARTSKTLNKEDDPTSPVTQHTKCKPAGNLLPCDLEF